MREPNRKKKELITMYKPFTTKGLSLVVALLLGLAAALVISGCGDDLVTTATDVEIAYLQVISTGTQFIGSTVTVEAKVIDATGRGTPVSGQLVTFSVFPSWAGSFIPAADTTAADGIVVTTFTAATAGTAQLWATAGDASESVTLEI
ncbi:MAG: hypothetical protein KAT58_09535, partial [candidate division Zixibacteria bacterium]|nr:hypothetical protein [candidate division Zixibacteria bacterium]